MGADSKGLRILIIFAALIIIIAGVKAAGPLLVNLLLSVFIAIISEPPVVWMQRRGIPVFAAVFIVLLVVISVSSLVMVYVGASVNDFTKSLPEYEDKWTDQIQQVTQVAQSYGVELNTNQLKDYFDPGIAMRMVARTFANLSDVFANTFLILLTVIFMLLEASSVPVKLRAALGGGSQVAMDKMGQVALGVNRYLAIKTVVSLVTGAVIAVWLAILGVDYPLLWGLLAFMLNYVPNIGSIIAAIPALLLALIQLDIGSTILVAAGYMATNIVMGNVIEPRIMGKGVGLSTLVVFLSLVFWGWVLGPVGMLLSVPLSMVAKIVLESNEQTRWLAIMLGSEAEARQIATAEAGDA